MKTRHGILISMLILLGAFGLSSCSKDDASVENDEVTQEMAAEIVGSSLVSGTSGAMADIEIIASFIDQSVNGASSSVRSTNSFETIGCGQTVDTTIIARDNGIVKFNYTKMYSFNLQCDASDNPTQLNTSFSYEGNFDAPRMTSSHSGEGNLVVTDIAYTSDRYLFNGTWSRSGNFESKIRNKFAWQANVQFAFVNISFERQSKTIDTGTINFKVSGSNSHGSYNYEGTITFIGDGKTEITISGSRYNVNMESGDVTASAKSII